MSTTINDIIKHNHVRALIERVCGDEYIIVTRPAMFAIKKPMEDERDINRLIILPPRGYTANEINQTNCFHNVEFATIEILGAVREDKKSFSILKNCLLNVSYDEMEKVSTLDRPYLTFNIDEKDSGFKYNMRSAGEPPFHVVKVDGTGFYHTLINMSDDWIVLKLNKALRPDKQVDIEQYLVGLQDEQANTIRQFHAGVIEHGDQIFEEAPELVTHALRLPMATILPALGEMLYVRDTGRHETCTAFAAILKLGRFNPEKVLQFLHVQLAANSIPRFFAEQLVEKIQRISSQDQFKQSNDQKVSS